MNGPAEWAIDKVLRSALRLRESDAERNANLYPDFVAEERATPRGAAIAALVEAVDELVGMRGEGSLPGGSSPDSTDHRRPHVPYR